ncbi:unnamed protein product, partial [Enterobius vermicularis]|uniref:Aspartyl aminopeptidase n=1 Tax=Enterobius vermicularis TaxID=51028 RepID=A0A0N4VF49_ENTVE
MKRGLVNFSRPLMYIPNLAIHLTSDVDKFECNKEEELKPILATLAANQLNDNLEDVGDQASTDRLNPHSILEEHHSSLLKLLSEETGCDPSCILDFDLYLYDSQPAAIGGIHQEFISSQRLDNLVGTYTTVSGLLESLRISSLAEEENIRFAACFDNEEVPYFLISLFFTPVRFQVGSGSAQGAESALCEWIMRRLSASNSQSSFEEAIANSYLLSVDNAHAVHPNYANKHERNHKPTLDGGVVVKVNVNQRYATTSTTHAIIKHIASTAGEPLQKVVVRNDMRCGTTVGPILASKLGIQTVDVGCPQLAMHSVRELMHVNSICQAIKLYSVCFAKFQTLKLKLSDCFKGCTTASYETASAAPSFFSRSKCQSGTGTNRKEM